MQSPPNTDVRNTPSGDGTKYKTPVSAGRQMSASLKERLRRSGRCRSAKKCTTNTLQSPRMCTTNTLISNYSRICTSNTLSSKTETLNSAKSLSEHNFTESSSKDLTCHRLPHPRQSTHSITPKLTLFKDHRKSCSSESMAQRTNDKQNKNTVAHSLKRSLDYDSSLDRTRELKKPLVESDGFEDLANHLGTSQSNDSLTSQSERSLVPINSPGTSNVLQRISDKKETLRKLKLVKKHREESEESKLDNLIAKWLDASHRAITDLIGIMPEPCPSVQQLLDHYGLDPELLDFDPELETFIS